MPAFKRIVFFIVLLTGCRGREVAIPLEFEGEKLVLWGKLEAGKPARVQVHKTFPAVGPVPEQTAVTHATVSLYKSGAFYALLMPLEESGLYGSDSLIQAGGQYVVKVEAPGLTPAESGEVTVPAAVPEFTYTRKRDAEPEKYQGSNKNLDLISLHFGKKPGNTYLSLGFRAFFESRVLPSTSPAGDNLVAKEEDCYTWANFYDRTYGTLFMMNGACVPVHTPLGFLVNTNTRLPLSDGTWVNQKAWKITLLLAVSTQEWFLYNQVEYKQPEGLDHLVLPPQKAYTNVKNGYGIIYGYHALETELE